MASRPSPNKSIPRRLRPPAGIATPKLEPAKLRDALLANLQQLEALCVDCFGKPEVAPILIGNLLLIARYVIGAEDVLRGKKLIREANAAIGAARRLEMALTRLSMTDRAIIFHGDPSMAFIPDPGGPTMLSALEHQQHFSTLLQRVSRGLRHLVEEAERNPVARSTAIDPLIYLTEILLVFWQHNTDREPESGKSPKGFGVFVKTCWEIIVATTGVSPRAINPTSLHNAMIQQLQLSHGAPRGRGRPSRKAKPK